MLCDLIRQTHCRLCVQVDPRRHCEEPRNFRLQVKIEKQPCSKTKPENHQSNAEPHGQRVSCSRMVSSLPGIHDRFRSRCIRRLVNKSVCGPLQDPAISPRPMILNHLMTRTGRSALLATASEVLPKSSILIIPFPLDAIAITPTSSSAAARIISFDGTPTCT